MQLQHFNFDGNDIRTQIDAYGNPWFVAKDVCEILKIEKYRDAVVRLDIDEREPVIVDTLGGPQSVTAINESGLYSLIMTSRKPEAKKFKKWVTSEVLPSIRKTGGYSVQAFKLPTTMAEALRLAADQAEQLEAQRPAVEFVEKYTQAAHGSMGFRQVCKQLKANEARFRDFLFDNDIMYRLNGDLTAYQNHINAGRFEVTTDTFNGKNRNICHFTAKGVVWIAQEWNKSQEV